MADNNGNHSPDEHPTKHDFPEVKGKIVDSVELTADLDYYGINIDFQDGTALTFSLESSVFAFPALEDWTTGKAKILKKYQPVQSALQGEQL